MSKQTIQWYPGHMHKARKEIAEAMPQMDLIIEVLDARIPYSSENPLISDLRGSTPCIKILNKSDLADPAITAQWLEYLEQEEGVKAYAFTTQEPSEIKKIPDLARQLVPNKEGASKVIKAMIMGIPNVGKSTTINILANRIIAKTGNEPAVTKHQQRINLQNGIVLSDTPGMLWPKVQNPLSGYRLAATGAIKDTAIEYDDIGMYAAEYLCKTYPEAMRERYKLDDLDKADIELLEDIGRARGCLRPGGLVDLNKAAAILINELRTAKICRISLETPAMAEQEKIEVAARLELEGEKKKKRKPRKKRR
jgi:ribosome biogenesis GTPase A